jgi:hypothetical protein
LENRCGKSHFPSVARLSKKIWKMKAVWKGTNQSQERDQHNLTKSRAGLESIKQGKARQAEIQQRSLAHIFFTHTIVRHNLLVHDFSLDFSSFASSSLFARVFI